MNAVARYWRRWNVQEALKGNASAMNRIYLIRDPWDLDTSEEHLRFAETTRVIRERIGEHFGKILEIGCGEGLQTRYLSSLAKRVVGLDPSPQAIKRTRDRQIPNASFIVGDLLQYESQPDCAFDLVTACEVLYYMRDLDRAYDKLTRLARHCVVTYHRGAFDQLDKYFADKQVKSETIRGASREWRVVYWVGRGT